MAGCTSDAFMGPPVWMGNDEPDEDTEDEADISQFLSPEGPCIEASTTTATLVYLATLYCLPLLGRQEMFKQLQDRHGARSTGGSCQASRPEYMLNVQPPWAWMLTNGIKRVENRGFIFPQRLPCWVAIIESKTRVTAATTEVAETLLALEDVALDEVPQRMRFRPRMQPPAQGGGQLVGFVQFVDCRQGNIHSPWYEGDPQHPRFTAVVENEPHGWIVGAYRPVHPDDQLKIPGKQSMCRLHRVLPTPLVEQVLQIFDDAPLYPRP